MRRRYLAFVTVCLGFGEFDAIAQELDAQIQRSQFEDCLSFHGHQSQNPFLVIRPGGIEIVSSSIPDGRTMIPATELRAFLVELPYDAWNHGRIVGAQDASIIGSRADLVPIAENHEIAQAVIEDLGLMVCWYPS
jgi:hypothetical protein